MLKQLAGDGPGRSGDPRPHRLTTAVMPRPSIAAGARHGRPPDPPVLPGSAGSSPPRSRPRPFATSAGGRPATPMTGPGYTCSAMRSSNPGIRRGTALLAGRPRPRDSLQTPRAGVNRGRDGRFEPSQSSGSRATSASASSPKPRPGTDSPSLETRPTRAFKSLFTASAPRRSDRIRSSGRVNALRSKWSDGSSAVHPVNENDRRGRWPRHRSRQ